MTQVLDECKVFIKEVRLRPPLWDKNNADYGHRETVEALWEELSKKFGVPTEQIKGKWRGLRDSFRRNVRREIIFRKTHPNEKMVQRWRYFVPMLFLKSQIKTSSKKGTSRGSSFIKPKVEQDDSDTSVAGDFMTEMDTLESNYEEPETCDLPRDANLDEKNMVFVDPQQNFQSQETFVSDNSKPSAVLADLLKSFQKDIIQLEKEKANTLNLDSTDDDVLFLHSLLPYFKSLDMKTKLVLRTKIQQLVCDHLTSEESKDGIKLKNGAPSASSTQEECIWLVDVNP